MAKMSIDEYNRKLSEKLGENEDLAIELMEDASDSFNTNDESEKLLKEKDAEINRINGELADLKAKYKDRFLTPASNDLVTSVKEDAPVELQEKNVIDIRVI